MALPDLTGQNIQDTYKRVLQVGDDGQMYDGTGSLFIPLSASHEVVTEISSSHAISADMIGNMSASAIKQAYDTATNNGQGQITFTELDNGTDNLSLTNLTTQGQPQFGQLTLGTAPASFEDETGRSSIFLPEGASGDVGVHLKVKTDTISPGVFLGGRNEDIITFVDQDNNHQASIRQTGEFTGTATTATNFNSATTQVLNNDIQLNGLNTSGQARHLISIQPDNHVYLAATGQPTSLRSDGIISTTGSLIVSGTNGTTGYLQVKGNITASGEISSSSGTGSFEYGQFSQSISASGTVTAAGIRLPGQGIISFDNSLDGTDQFIKGGDEYITIEGDNFVKFRADEEVRFQNSAGDIFTTIEPNTGHIYTSGSITGSHTQLASITASADISASGTGSFEYLTTSQSATIGSDLYVDVIRRQSDSSTTTKIKLDDEKIKFFANDTNNQTVQIEQNELTITGDVSASNEISASRYIGQSYNIISHGGGTTDNANFGPGNFIAGEAYWGMGGRAWKKVTTKADLEAGTFIAGGNSPATEGLGNNAVVVPHNLKNVKAKIAVYSQQAKSFGWYCYRIPKATWNNSADEDTIPTFLASASIVGVQDSYGLLEVTGSNPTGFELSEDDLFYNFLEVRSTAGGATSGGTIKFTYSITGEIK